MGQRTRSFCAFLAATSAILAAVSFAAADPPASYYATATGTGATLKQQLKKIIDGVNDPDIAAEWLHTSVSYDDLRSVLQVTDRDPSKPFNASSRYLLLIYNQESLNVAPINPNGSIPGWNNGTTWNREHVWPQSRGLNGTGAPDGSDLHHLRASRTTVNGDRGETNFGGAFGLRPGGQPFGEWTSGGDTFWYPGDADAGWVARSQFYMAVRYDGTDGSTQNLELANGDVDNVSGANDPPPQAGDLASLIEWHFAAPPNAFEINRNDLIFNSYQSNRNPFIDHPEFVWSIFKGTANNSQISIVGGTDGGNGGYTREVDLGRVFVGSAVPAAENFTLNKGGTDGTYFEVTVAGDATSSVSGRLNAFRTNLANDTKPITVGINPAASTTATAGLKSGTVAIDNLDITNAGGSGQGASDANDVFNVSLTVLEHAQPSFLAGLEEIEYEINLGSFEVGEIAPMFGFDVFNHATSEYTADLDFDSFNAVGDSSVLTTNLGDYDGLLTLGPGASQQFFATISTAAEGIFEATYTLNFSDEDIAGALTSSLTLTLMGEVTASVELLAGDYNLDGVVDAVDYTVWRNTYGTTVEAFAGADGDGDTIVDDDDFGVWRDNYGNVALPPGSGGLASTAVPEPATLGLIVFGMLIAGRFRRN